MRFNLLLTEEQANFLGKLPGTASEHVRRAIDEYIEKIKAKSVSESKSKRGDVHGS